MGYDPLDGIENLPIETQVALLVSNHRTTRNTLARIERKVDWVNRSLWTLIATIIAGIVVYAITTSVKPSPVAPAKATPPPAKAIFYQPVSYRPGR